MKRPHFLKRRNGIGFTLITSAFLRQATTIFLMTSLCAISVAPTAAQQADADVLTAEAALAYDGQRYADALKLIQKALGFDPRNHRALYYLGLIQLARQQPDQAAAAFESLQSLRPSDPDITYQLGVAHFAAGNYDKAPHSWRRRSGSAPPGITSATMSALCGIVGRTMTGPPPHSQPTTRPTPRCDNWLFSTRACLSAR